MLLQNYSLCDIMSEYPWEKMPTHHRKLLREQNNATTSIQTDAYSTNIAYSTKDEGHLTGVVSVQRQLLY